ncbi:MAG: TraB/GumN family protein [Candidatus Nucleicultricaceae bacterium]
MGDTPLSGIHPFIVAVTLRRMRSIKEKLMGAMDEQILKEFTLKRKPIFFLETIGDLVAKVCQKTNTELISQFFIKQTTLEEIICDAQQLELLSKEMPKPHYEKVNECGAMMVQQYYLNPQFAKKIIDQDLIKRNTLWIPRLMQYFADHPDKSFVVVAGAAHFPSDHGILKLLADLGMFFSVFDQSTAQNQKPLPPFKAKQPEYKLEKEIAAAEEEKIKTRTKALDLADVFLKKDLPTLNTHFGIDQKFVVNISELVITMFRILKTKPGLVPAEYRILLMNYIMTKDAIYDAPEITDKNKAFEMLHANPLLTFEQLKQEAKAISAHIVVRDTRKNNPD